MVLEIAILKLYKLIFINMQILCTVKKSAHAIGQNRSGDFGLSVNNSHDRAVNRLTFWVNLINFQ